MTQKKILSKFYFSNFKAVNLLVLFIVFCLLFIIPLSTFAIAIYTFILFGFAVYAGLNYELGRQNAAYGAWCFFFLLLRTMVAVAIRSQQGAFGLESDHMMKYWYQLLTSDGIVAAFAVVGLFGIYFLIKDMHVAVTVNGAKGH